MAGIMLVKQAAADLDRYQAAFNSPEVEAAPRRHGLYVDGIYLAAGEPATVIVVMQMGDPEGVWLGESRLR
jgi:hypothetical protein